MSRFEFEGKQVHLWEAVLVLSEQGYPASEIQQILGRSNTQSIKVIMSSLKAEGKASHTTRDCIPTNLRLSRRTYRKLKDQAETRFISPRELIQKILVVVASEPTLVANLLDE